MAVAVAPSKPCGHVLVVDDRPTRSLLVDLFSGAGYEVSDAETAEEALDVARRNGLDAVVLDVKLPGGASGYSLCGRLREQDAKLGIVLLSGERTEPSDRVAGLLIGADDYVVKPFDPDELLARIRALLRRAGRHRGDGRRLTAREREVLTLLADGLSQREIAERLVISANTVGTHLEHILGKLDVHSRAQAVAVAFREALLGGD
jgi:DNA-binding NarL/FixJ family response regulator